MAYAQFGMNNAFNSTTAGTLPNSSLDSQIGVARYLHYDEAFGHIYLLDFILPFGTLTNGKIDGQRVSDASGVADPVFSLGVWLINEPDQKRWLSAVSFVSFPIGSYDRHRALNLGNNRWQHDLQFDYTQGLFKRFTLDVSGDWIYYGDNTEAGTGRQTLSQDSTFGAYLWLSYDITDALRQTIMPRAVQASLSIGYAGIFGGEQRLDGSPTGVKTGEEQIRVNYTQYITPTWQGSITLTHDMSASGQFKQDFGLILRVAKVF